MEFMTSCGNGDRSINIYKEISKLEGLNPLMFLFALIGNATYVARYAVGLHYLLYFKSQHQGGFFQLNIMKNLTQFIDGSKRIRKPFRHHVEKLRENNGTERYRLTYLIWRQCRKISQIFHSSRLIVLNFPAGLLRRSPRRHLIRNDEVVGGSHEDEMKMKRMTKMKSLSHATLFKLSLLEDLKESTSVKKQEVEAQVVNLVVKKAPKLLFLRNKNNDTALHVAARAGHNLTIQKLLEAYSDFQLPEIADEWREFMGHQYDVDDYDEQKM
ncbi:hypothetical protein Fmac_030897 [Flemingia macrophylla]|uniref:Uncharacterized protein n=1 Tax=Flemingia macrophylla TaxID=520843 RepID=A0ABD1L0K6_9FABA